MDYRTKIKHAEKVAVQLEEQKSTETIKTELKTEGLYEPDIVQVMMSARKILGEKYQPKIGEYLLNNKQIHGAPDFKLLDTETLDILITRESQKFALEEKRKITKLIKEGQSPEQVFQQVDTRFLAPNKAAEHIGRLEEVKGQNSASGRMLNIFGGIGLIVLTGIILVATDRLFYVLPFIGLGLIIKGFLTEPME